MGRWIGRYRRACRLAISLLILALLPTPLPKVEFHNVRHHDAPGQVCEYHDHLLRWHPDARGARDVAVLHWHWAWPEPGTPDGEHDSNGPRLHAHLAPDSLAPGDPRASAVVDTAVRTKIAPVPEPPPQATTWVIPSLLPIPPSLHPDGSPALTFGATFAPGASLTSRLHRWTC